MNLTYEEFIERHRSEPASIEPYLELLSGGAHLSEDQARSLHTSLAARVSDPALLERLLGLAPDLFKNFYPSGPLEGDTDSVIDSFLAKFGPKNPASIPSGEVPLVPAYDYAASLEAAAPAPADTPPLAQPALTESLAKIMIRQGRYDKAAEILTELNLNNPRKSVYFADQIRFLRKLAQNSKQSLTN